jgi:glycosyltransferase involved in cell wall biosynthesis
MNKPSLFIILIPGFPSSESDKNCLPFQQKFVKTFQENHPELEVAVLAFQYPYSNTSYSWHDIRIFSFGGKNRGGLQRLLLRKKLFKKLRALHKDYQIKGLLSFWCGECAVVGGKFARRYHLKHFCWICGQDAMKENKYPQRMNAGSGEFIALSDFLQDAFHANHHIRPAHVITPGIDLSDFAPGSKTKDIDLLAAGSLIPLKQFEIFLETVAVLKRSLPSIKAVLAGEGPEKNNLQDLVRLFGLENNLEIKGELPHQELMQMMQRAKLFLHPSRYEGFGVVCLEALHAGAMVISFVKPMKEDFPNWHIAKNKLDMADIAAGLLERRNAEEISSFPFDIRLTVEKLAALYA